VSGGVLILVGLLLGFIGVRSLRLTMLLVGFGAGWFLAEVFDAQRTTALLIGAAAGVVLLFTAILAARIIFFVLGGVTGVVVGAKLFYVVDRGDSSLILAFVFIPAVAISGAFLAERWREKFMRWATAAAGAALALSGLGLFAPKTLGALANPDEGAAQAVSFLAWVALGAVMLVFQKRQAAKDDD